MSEIIQKKVYDILDKLKNIGVDDNKIVEIAILHTNQLMEQSVATAGKILYKSMLDMLNKRTEDSLNYQCIVDWNHYNNNKDIKIKSFDNIPTITLPLKKFDRITFNNKVRGGKPCVKGTEITVMDVLLSLSNKTSYNEVIIEFTELKEEDIKECIEYSNYVLTNVFDYVKKNNT